MRQNVIAVTTTFGQTAVAQFARTGFICICG